MVSTSNNYYFNYLFLATISLGGILFGYDIGVISGALLFIRKSIPMDEWHLAFVVGAVLVGNLIGTIIAGPTSDYWGRKIALTNACLLFILGIVFTLIAQTFTTLFIARLFLGAGAGVLSVAVPLYTTEVAPALHRGKYLAYFQLLIITGIVCSYFIDLLFTAQGNWRAMFAVALFPAIALLICAYLLPESPRWLMVYNKMSGDQLNNSPVQSTLHEIANNMVALKKETKLYSSSWRELLQPATRGAFFIAIAVAILNQLTGINPILQFAPIMLLDAGMSSNMTSMLGTVGIGLINLIVTLCMLPLIDKVGRRPLFITGLIGIILSECFLASIHTSTYFTSNLAVLNLLGLFAFSISYAIGPGLIYWLAISEHFATKLRGRGVAISMAINSITVTLLVTLFLPLVNKIGYGMFYGSFAFCSLIYLSVVYYFLPETKAQALERLQLIEENN